MPVDAPVPATPTHGKRHGGQPQNLRKRVVESLLALTASTAAGQTANTLSQLLLAAILARSEYGAISVAIIVTTAATVARNAFVFQTLIHRPTRVRESADQIIFVSITIGALLCGAAWIGADKIGLFFQSPESAGVLRLTTLAFFIDSIGSVPDTLFEKELRFRRKMWLEISKPLIVAVLSVGLALAGIGPLCVGYAQVVGYGFWTIGLYVISDYRPRPRWDPRLLRELLGYGRYVLAGSLLVFFFTNLDNASVGRVLGAAALGSYAFAFLLGYFPAKVLTEGVVAAVVLPVFSKAQGSREAQATAVYTTLGYVSYYAAPLALISILIGPAALHAAYGHKWDTALLPFQILAVYGFAHSYFLVTRNFCNGTGRARIFWRISGLQLALALPFLAIAPLKFGIVGTAALFTAGKICATIVGVAYIRSLTGLRAQRLFRAVVQPLLLAGVAGALAWGALTELSAHPLGTPHTFAGKWLPLLLSVLLFGVVYAVECLLTDRVLRNGALRIIEKVAGRHLDRTRAAVDHAVTRWEETSILEQRLDEPPVIDESFDAQETLTLWRVSIWNTYAEQLEREAEAKYAALAGDADAPVAPARRGTGKLSIPLRLTERKRSSGDDETQDD
jgi:O-antigen/teichoic acid export membrane protein